MAKATKSANTENFPVASLFLSKDIRQDVMDFYQFARMADDIADSPHMAPAEKLEALDIDTECPFQKKLLTAFRQDVTKSRYQSFEELLDYCENSANPVGRFLLSLHNEEGMEEQSDALCTILQILNHLQDCQKDFQQLNRIYLPQDFFQQGCILEDELSRNKTSPLLRNGLDQCLNEVESMLKIAEGLPSLIKNRRLRYQAKVTFYCALALLGKLKRQDPLAKRVELGTVDKLLLAYKGLFPL